MKRLLILAGLIALAACSETPEGDFSVTVVTDDASGVGIASASLNGSFFQAGCDIREVGFEWGMDKASMTDVLQADYPGGRTGKFSAKLEALGEEKTYYYKAYVVLQNGDDIRTFYGETLSFTTLKGDSPHYEDNSPQPGWAELPAMDIVQDGTYMVSSSDNSLYYAWHISPDVQGPEGKLARNYTVCFSADYHCPVWVAAPRHSMYVGSSGRTDAYGPDPDVPANIQYYSKSTGGGCNKGHMLGSAERTCSRATNQQVFYYTNIAPQLSAGFNTGKGGWNILEDYVDKQVCADTLYEVLGTYFQNYTDGYGKSQSPSYIEFGGRTDVAMPTMFYYALLRTKSGNSGKSVKDCSADELKCVAFVRTHTNDLKGQNVSSKELMSISDLERLTGFTYFPNVPNAPKSTFNAADWGL